MMREGLSRRESCLRYVNENLSPEHEAWTDLGRFFGSVSRENERSGMEDGESCVGT